jgi:hypothetical protein
MKTVETSPRFSISQLKALDTWPKIIEEEEVTITVGFEGTAITTKVELVFDRSPFGLRPWLSCPECGSRRKDLFVDHGELKCRRCLRLLYYSQRLPDSSWRDVALPLLRAARPHDQLRKPGRAG